MYDIFNLIREDLEQTNKIPSKTILNLNPSSQVCFDRDSKNIGTCLRQIWFTKNDFEKTNKIPVTNISHLAGSWYEQWFITSLKNMGVHYQSNFPATDPSRLVKGIVDVAFLNEKKEIELGEVKSYDGSNYYNAQHILGTKSSPPKPKDKHLLQAFRYSLIFQDTIPNNNLFYIDRACSQWYKNKQFKIELNNINNVLYPKISTIWNNEYYEYTDTRISDLGMYTAEEKLLEYFSNNTVPPRDFIEEYSPEEAEYRIAIQEVPDYLAKKYQKDPYNNPLGDGACKFCPYAKGLCKTYEDSL